MSRLLAVVLIVTLPIRGWCQVVDPAAAKPDEKSALLWYDVRSIGVEGQGWTDTKAPFDRLPAKAEALVRPPVWNLSRHSTGLCVRFVANTSVVHGRWTVTNGKSLAMPHMPATGVSGLDLYAKTDSGVWQWIGVGRPTAETNTTMLAGGLPAGEREFILYFPLYNGVSSVEIGVPKGVALKKAPERPETRRKPIVFYGTSITQGGCASRPGMVHTAILGRRLQVPIINLGFSGNGTLDPEFAELMSELDAAIYVLDCLPNLYPQQVAERTEPFIRALRKRRAMTPIVMVEDRTYANAPLNPASRKRNDDSRLAYRRAFDTLTGEGMMGLHYLPGEHLIGDDGEGTVDGSHPTDLGFIRQADAFEKVLAPLLK